MKHMNAIAAVVLTAVLTAVILLAPPQKSGSTLIGEV